MRVAMVNLTGGGLSGGYQKYIATLSPRLQNDPRMDSLTLLLPEQVVDSFASLSIPIYGWPGMDAGRGYPWLKTRVRDLKPDVVFIPTARWLDFNGIPTVVMVRNMEPFNPFLSRNPWRERLKNLGRMLLARRACQHATRILAVSGYVRDFLIQRWRIESDRIGLVYHGVEAPPDPEETAPPAALQGRQIERFLFTAGSIRPLRGLEDAIEALGLLRQAGERHTLVVGGKPDPGLEAYQERMKRLARRNGVESQILWVGHLQRREMSWCYSHCDLFITTSRVEACPNTVLEVMRHGCLSISTDNPPMPEFYRDSAFYYRAGDAAALARRIQEVYRCAESEKQRMRRRAKERGSEFNWDNTARQTVAELEQCLRREQTLTAMGA